MDVKTLPSVSTSDPHGSGVHLEREFFIANLLVCIHFIILMILRDRPCAMGVCIPFSMQLNIYLPIGVHLVCVGG